MKSQRRLRGQVLIEWLVSAPILLFVGLGAFQLGFVMHARGALEHAVHEAMRAAVTGHGLNAAIADGMAKGLAPFWREPSRDAAVQRLRHARAVGIVSWERLGPDPTVFADFAQAARDPHGRPIAGVLEIPNDNLQYRSMATGARSGLTLAQANRLSMVFRFAVPLNVPFAGPLFGQIWGQLNGCSGFSVSANARVNVRAEGGVGIGAITRQLACAGLRLADMQGQARWRWPVIIKASMMMHSPLRQEEASASADGRARPPMSRDADRVPSTDRQNSSVPDEAHSGQEAHERAGSSDSGVPPDGDQADGNGTSPQDRFPVESPLPASHAPESPPLANRPDGLDQSGQCE